LAFFQRALGVWDEPGIDLRRAKTIGRNVYPLARVIGVRNGIVAELLDWHTAAAVPVIPACHDQAWPMFHRREHGNFAPYHVPDRGFVVGAYAADERGSWLLNLDGELRGGNLYRLQLSKYKRLVLLDLERRILDNVKLRIGDTDCDLGRRIAPQERNAQAARRTPMPAPAAVIPTAAARSTSPGRK